MSKKILVTGGAGFIGSNLIEELLKDPQNQVYSLDNYFIGKKTNHLPGATYLEGSTQDISRVITDIPDLVYHLGEYSRVEQSFEDIEKVWEFNKQGTFAVLEFCRNYNIKIIYAGSSTKFANNGGRDQSPYAWIKATNTELVKNYHQWFGLAYAVAYFYNVYGPRELSEGKYATVLGIFKEQTKKREPLTVVLPGTQRRNFTYVGDIVQGLILVGERGEGDNYCLGSEESYSILEIAQLFGGEVKMLPERKGNRINGSLDLSRSRGELGWSVKVSVKDHIRDFLNSLKSVPG